MRLSRLLLPLLAFSWVEACSVYHDGLLGGDDEDSDSSSGGKASGGKSAGGEDGESGGRSGSGGRASGGAGTGGESTSETGGKPDNMGGGSGGGSPPAGGAAPSGGTDGSGGESPGTGGAPAKGPFLLTDMGRSTISNSPFFGKIERYSQAGTTWAASNVTGMLKPREDDEDNLALHVQAAFDADDWGIDIAITLKSGQPFDLSSYKTISFELKGVPDAEVRVGLEDYASHRGSNLCGEDGVGDDCDKHVESLATYEPGPDWEVIDIDFSSFEGCGLGCERTYDLDMTRVYAIHFKMDPPEDAGVDFFLDNIYIDN